MAQGRKTVRQGGATAFAAEVVTRIRHRRARKIRGIAIGPADHLDDVGVEEIGRIGNRMRHGGDVRPAAGQLAHGGKDHRRIDQRFVTLHIDDDRVVAPATLGDHFGQAVGTARMIAARHQRRHFVRLAGSADFGMIGGDPDFLGARLAGPFGNPHDHRPPAEIKQRLGWQTGRRVTRRNDDLEGRRAHASPASSWRASSSSITGMSSRIG